MIYIIEGTDGVGKTTFATWLANRLGFEYLHAGPPAHSTPWEEYVLPLDSGKNYVLDRWHVGEIVWPYLFGRESIFNRGTGQFQALTRDLFDLHDARMILMQRDPMEIRQELESRGESDEAISLSLEAGLAFGHTFGDLIHRIRPDRTHVMESGFTLELMKAGES